jgi:outer membrane protein assembly factor BamB
VRRSIVIAVDIAVLLMVTAIPLDAGMHTALAAGAGTASPPTYTWPGFHNTPNLDGVSADPTITSGNASTLGVSWMSPVGSSDASPVVSWNATLAKTLAFTGNFNGDLSAVDTATGAIVWSTQFASSFVGSPASDGTSVWAAPVNGNKVFKLNAATGAIECSASVSGPVQDTPVLATPTGGHEMAYFATLNGSTNGSLYGLDASNCSRVFAWSNYNSGDTGSWDPLSYGVDGRGEPLIVFGSTDPDSTVYAVDALTGASVWSHYTNNPPGFDWDVGSGITLSAPGANGFADGVAYVDGKDGVFYALDLNTGSPIWTYDFGGGVSTDALSTPALGGTTLVFGDNSGIYALDAVTGAVLWRYETGGDTVNSAPAIVGPPNDQVVAFGTLGGLFHVVSLATGTPLYSYTTHGYVSSSPADSEGTLLIDSSDGNLYDFALGGGNGASPTTTVTMPASGSTIANPDGTLTISGSASAPHHVQAVNVEVQEDGSSGPWYKQATQSFSPGLGEAVALLASPGASSTTWSLTIPVPLRGGTFLVQAEAVDQDGIADTSGATGQTGPAVSTFTVETSPKAPQVSLSPGVVAPGGSLTLSATQFQPGETVTFTVPERGGSPATLATGVATSSGTVGPLPATLPTKQGFGPVSVTATGGISAMTGATSVYVSNESTQLGYGPGRQGYEANDPVMNSHQALGQAFLKAGWTFTGAAPMDSTPAVADDVAYVGDEAGHLYAVELSTGVAKWSRSLSGGVDSSPAVDAGLVFVGDLAHHLVALNAATGATVWNAILGSSISASPAVSGGVVYDVTSGGRLSAFSEHTGAILWSVSLGSKSQSSPAVDTAAGVVVVGDQAGTVRAFSVADGSPRWSYSSGSPVLAPPVLGLGDVFVGAQNGTFFALSESTGVLDWKHKVGGSITGPAMINGGSGIAVGSSNGNVVTFNASTGAVNASEPAGGPVVGVTSTVGIYLFTTTTGLAMWRGAGGARQIWSHNGTGGYASPALILNGEVLAAGSDGVLRTFVVPGNPVY